MSSPPGIAILGAGIFAKEAHLPALASLGDDAPVLKAVYSRSEKSATDLANAAKEKLKLSQAPTIYYDGNPSGDLDALLSRDDIAAVIVILPINSQPAIILKALEKGKHVLSEKPVAPDVEKAKALIQEYEAQYKPKGLVWRVAENFEAEPGYRAAAKAIRDGKIGDVQFFKATVLNYVSKDSKYYKTPWRTVPDYQGGFLLDGGVHTIAALRTILPYPLTHISSFASLNKDYLMPHDTINAILKSEGHYHGTLDMTFAFPTEKKPKTDSYLVSGSAGWLTINSAGTPPVVTVEVNSVKGSHGGKDEVVQEVIEEAGRGVEVEWRSFLGAIAGKDDGQGLGDPNGALVDVSVIQAALNSNGDLVDLGKLVAA
ncbi:oxidoreductase family protein [Ephemerocybe angulata]|uniref:Oxidoreductase family protein n=1 Tax=Ephemerocybe angulata TaxID=980116 RepID=A0A8H6I3B6_9AGAR|nr:oxidoreductase family protein [Tulosesus angulatus]